MSCVGNQFFRILPFYNLVLSTIIAYRQLRAGRSTSAPSTWLTYSLRQVTMDPLTAFSLACGVIQIVDYSTKTLMKCREIYKEGSLSDYQSLENYTKHLIDVREKLDIHNDPQSTGSPTTVNDQSLIELSRQCSETAGQLVTKLQVLKILGPRKKRQAILKTVKLLWEKGETDEIEKRLGEYRKALDTQILVSLRSVWSNSSAAVYIFSNGNALTWSFVDDNSI